MAPSSTQIATMAKEWAGTDQTAFTTALYHRMFTTKPEWKKLFGKFPTDPLQDGHAEFKKQVESTRAALDKAVQLAASGADDQLLSTLHALAKRHVSYKVGQEHFQALKPILSEVVREQVPKADKTAWDEVCGHVLNNIVVE